MAGLEELFDQLDPFRIPPVASWHPDTAVDIDIQIRSDGQWNYQGSPINRHRIVKLFSTVLRLDQGDYFLVTPPVKYRIRVDDVPFVAVELNRQVDSGEQQLFFRTNMDEVVLADREHPIEIEPGNDATGPLPYVTIRDQLKARISRPVYYELAGMLEDRPGLGHGIESAGEFFLFGNG